MSGLNTVGVTGSAAFPVGTYLPKSLGLVSNKLIPVDFGKTWFTKFVTLLSTSVLLNSGINGLDTVGVTGSAAFPVATYLPKSLGLVSNKFLLSIFFVVSAVAGGVFRASASFIAVATFFSLSSITPS